MPPDTLGDRIARAALDHYAKVLPQKGKPQEKEWTVYAAIIAVNSSNKKMWTVASATGTKCTAERCQGCIVHDAHAEVLARRGLQRVLWTEIHNSITTDTSKSGSWSQGTRKKDQLLLERIQDDCSSDPRFRLRHSVQLHLYISDAPCGDASIYSLGDMIQSDLQFTGAKVIVAPETNVSVEACGENAAVMIVNNDNTNNHTGAVLAREDTQLLGKLRSKSGRSNLEDSRRSSSMSCSDKLVRWGVLGLQGHVLSSFLLESPIVLTSLVVSRDPRVAKNGSLQAQALQRAVPDRIRAVLDLEAKQEQQQQHPKTTSRPHPPAIHIVNEVFSRGKSVVEASSSTFPGPANEPPPRKKQKRLYSPAGLSIHWQSSDPTVELLVGARGIRQGKKPKVPADFSNLKSRLSRAAMAEFARSILGSTSCSSSKSSAVEAVSSDDEDNNKTTETYQEWKARIGSDEYAKRKKKVLLEIPGGPLAGWMVASSQNDFSLSTEASS